MNDVPKAISLRKADRVLEFECDAFRGVPHTPTFSRELPQTVHRAHFLFGILAIVPTSREKNACRNGAARVPDSFESARRGRVLPEIGCAPRRRPLGRGRFNGVHYGLVFHRHLSVVIVDCRCQPRKKVVAIVGVLGKGRRWHFLPRR